MKLNEPLHRNETELLESPEGMLASETVAIVPGDNSRHEGFATFQEKGQALILI